MTIKEFLKLQEKYNKPRDPKQQEKYQKYEEKIREIMKKPPNDKQHYLMIGINEIKGGFERQGKGYFYEPKENLWCVYTADHWERSNDILFSVYMKKETEEEAFQCIYQSLEENVIRHERELEREKNHRMTKEEFLEWFRQDNRETRLAEKGPYQILWDSQPGEERYAVGYYYEIRSEYIRANYGDDWVAYVIMDGKYRMKMSYRHETRAIYMMQYWIQLILDGKMGQK